MTFSYGPAEVATVLVAFARVGGIVMVLPGVGDESVAPRARLMIALALTLVLLPTAAISLPVQTTAVPIGLMARELALGVALGAMARIVFLALASAGGIIALQSGLASAMMFDPAAGAQNVVIGRLLSLAGIVALFAANMHHAAITGIAKSYELFPAAGPLPIDDLLRGGIAAVAESFAIAVRLAAPFLLFGLVFNLGLGFMARLAPTIQVFFIAQPLSILASFALLATTIGLILTLFVSAVSDGLAGLFG